MLPPEHSSREHSHEHTLNGTELLPCPAPNASPSCTTGGTHTTKVESYLRVQFDARLNWWTFWSRNGTRTICIPIYDTPSGTLRWGHSTTIDTHSNNVTYTWACPADDDCYPETVVFGPYSVQVTLEARPDVMSFATGHEGTIRRVRSRLHSVVVRYDGALIREYRLAYATSGLTNRSLLQSVQEHGNDGSTLPPHVFEYQTDPLGASFQRWGE